MAEKKSPIESLRQGEYLKAWRELKETRPGAYTAAAVAPVTGQLAAIADYADAMDRGDSVDGITAAASLIPGIALGKYAGKLAPSAFRAISEMNSVEKAINPIVKKAPTIGKAAAAQQIAEYATSKARADQDQKEYLDAWASEDKR